MLHWLTDVIFSTESARATLLQRGDADEASAAPLCSKVALLDSVEDPLEASPLCSKVALADLVEDPLEASPLYSKVALADLVNFHLLPLQLRSLKLLHFAAHLRM